MILLFGKGGGLMLSVLLKEGGVVLGRCGSVLVINAALSASDTSNFQGGGVRSAGCEVDFIA